MVLWDDRLVTLGLPTESRLRDIAPGIQSAMSSELKQQVQTACNQWMAEAARCFSVSQPTVRVLGSRPLRVYNSQLLSSPLRRARAPVPVRPPIVRNCKSDFSMTIGLLFEAAFSSFMGLRPKSVLPQAEGRSCSREGELRTAVDYGLCL